MLSPNNFLDVITLQVCDELDIKKAVIRGSKIDNYVITADALDGSSSQLNDAYAAARFSQDTIEQARNYLVRASQGVVYEGTFLGVNKRVLDSKILREQFGVFFRYFQQYGFIKKSDPHIPNLF